MSALTQLLEAELDPDIKKAMHTAMAINMGNVAEASLYAVMTQVMRNTKKVPDDLERSGS